MSPVEGVTVTIFLVAISIACVAILSVLKDKRKMRKEKQKSDELGAKFLEELKYGGFRGGQLGRELNVRMQISARSTNEMLDALIAPKKKSGEMAEEEEKEVIEEFDPTKRVIR